jgi:hypothetical protein
MLRNLPGVILVAAFCFHADAQTATGILQGVVTDSSGAAVPDAKVTVENQRTSVLLSLLTNTGGRFVQPFLIPSEYRLTVEKAGFQKYVTSDIRVDVQQTVALDITLTVGEVTSAVEVTASAVQLATETSSVSTVVDMKRILDLPLNGRNPFSLATTAPGVIPGGGSTPWISGGRNASSDITVDGTTIILPENNTGILQLGYQPIVDSIEEFTIITNSLAAEYGRTGGGVINVSTRSGTNGLHFTLFEFLRNNNLEANTWGNRRNNTALPALQRNEFGGSVGGPVQLPKIYNGKDKTFFFFSEQSVRARNGTSSFATVPIDAWRNGDFSDLRNGSGAPITLYDPLQVGADGNRASFPGNQIPVTRFNPIARNLLKFWPEPNAVPTNTFTRQNNFFVNGKSPSRDDKFDSRLDHNFSSKLRTWARGSYEYGSSAPLNGFGDVATSIGDGPVDFYHYNVALNTIYTVSTTTVVNFNYGVGRRNLTHFAFSKGFDMRTLGFPATLYNQAATLGLEFPRFNIAGLNGTAGTGNTNISALGQATFTTLKDRDLVHALRSDLTKIVGNHTMKFGGEYRKLFLNFTQLGQPDGQYEFGSEWTQRQAGTTTTSTTQGSGFASFLLGLPHNANSTIEHTFDIASASSYFGFYAQDDWKLSSGLTVNLGLRWDLDTPHTERYNRLSYWDIGAPSPIAGQVPGFSNLKGAMKFVTPDNRRQVPMVLHNWGPRVGFAYKIDPKTVFRGAYALMYAPSVLQAAGTSGSSGTEGFRSSTPMTVTTDNTTILADLSNPFPNGFNLPLGAAPGPISGPRTNLGLGIGESFFNDWVNPAVQQWNGNLQRELPGGWLVEAAYLGSKGNHLPDGESSLQYNQLNPSILSTPDRDRLIPNSANLVPNPFVGIITNPASTLRLPTVQYGQLLRPFPQYTSVGAFRKPSGNSLYHGFSLRVEKRFSQGLTALIAYTAGKLIDDVSQQVSFLGAAAMNAKQDFYNRRAERSISAQDVSRRLVVSGTYNLPFGRDRKFLASIPKPVDFVLGGWQANGIATFQTGTPIQIGNGQNALNIFSSNQRASATGIDPFVGGPISDRLNHYFNQAAFVQSGNFVIGTLGRFLPNVRGVGQNNIDFSLFKNFRYRERLTMQFRAEAFNLANHPYWNNPGTTVSDLASFGIVNTKGTQRRIMQLGLKLIF